MTKSIVRIKNRLTVQNKGIHLFCFLLVAAASQAASGPDESGEASVEVPEAATVDVEEIHPLPEVSTNYTVIAENI